jgi:HSP20 family molecular chaperone IbpA
MATEKEKISVRPATQAGREAEEEAFAPLVDVYQKDDGTIVLVAEVPGAAADSVDIRVDKGVLTIEATANVPQPEGEFTRTYTGFVGGRYFRAFALSDEVDREKIDASLADGVLTVTLPRAAAARTRKIEIKAQ